MPIIDGKFTKTELHFLTISLDNSLKIFSTPSKENLSTYVHENIRCFEILDDYSYIIGDDNCIMILSYTDTIKIIHNININFITKIL